MGEHDKLSKPKARRQYLGSLMKSARGGEFLKSFFDNAHPGLPEDEELSAMGKWIRDGINVFVKEYSNSENHDAAAFDAAKALHLPSAEQRAEIDMVAR